MAITVTVANQKWFNEYKNGVGFGFLNGHQEENLVNIGCDNVDLLG